MIETESGEIIYELEGTKDNVTYEIQVNDQGKVIRSGPASDFENEKREKKLFFIIELRICRQFWLVGRLYKPCDLVLKL